MISKSKQRRTTMRYTSQGAPCPRHFYDDQKAYNFFNNIDNVHCAVNAQ